MAAVSIKTEKRMRLCSKAVTKISSLLQKPESGQTPAIASVAIAKVQKVTGMDLRSPPISRMS